jgi:2-amino-4-hydroxy-6-hydroxymethyldihydropteridine diphosphokinase
MTLAVVALGANLPFAGRSAKDNLRLVMLDLQALPCSRVIAHSRLWQSAPVKAEGPVFLNACSLLETELAPLALLDSLLALEARWGRVRPHDKKPALAPARSLDLDLIWMEGFESCTDQLQMPHPRASSRSFVLGPLLDLTPWFSKPVTLPHPVTNSPWRIEELWQALPESQRAESQPLTPVVEQAA